jgi:uncharacterized phiE125 gp8 family phage protein
MALVDLVTTVGPTAEPISLSDAKNYLRLTGTRFDTVLTRLITACRLDLEKELRRAFLTQTLLATYELEFPKESPMAGIWWYTPSEFVLAHPPIQSVTTVQLETSPSVFTTLDPSAYAVRLQTPPFVIMGLESMAGVIVPWWIGLPAVPRAQITYIAGYTSVDAIPVDYVQLLYELIANRFLATEGEVNMGRLQARIAANKVWSL